MRRFFLGGKVAPTILVDYEAFDKLNRDVRCTVRFAQIVHSERRIGEFKPGTVNSKFIGDAVEFWSGMVKRAARGKHAKVTEGSDHDLEHDVNDGMEADVAPLGAADLVDGFDGEFGAIADELDYLDVAGDIAVIDEATI